MNDWSPATLGDAGTFTNGFAFGPQHWGDRGLPIIRIEQMLRADASADYFDGPVPEHYRIDDGAILMSWSGTIEVVRWSRGPALVNQHLFKVEPSSLVTNRFLFHLLKASLDRLAAGSHGTTIKHIKRKDLLLFGVVLPSLDEQRRIAEILDTTDEWIESTERLIAKLDAIYHGLLADLILNAERAWELRRLEDCVEILDHLRIPVRVEDRPSGNVPYYGANGQQGWIDRPIFNEPLILLAEDGGFFDEFATRPIAYWVDGPSWVNNHAHVLRARQGINQRFLYYSLQHRDIRRFIAGGTRSKLAQGELRSIEIGVPDEHTQRAVADVLSCHAAAGEAERRLLACLCGLRAGLAVDLLSGRVRTVAS